jgi:hypothetical protein
LPCLLRPTLTSSELLQDLLQDLAKATGHSFSNFSLKSLSPGSVVAVVAVKQSEEQGRHGRAVVQQLIRQAADINAPLWSGVITRFTESIEFADGDASSAGVQPLSMPSTSGATASDDALVCEAARPARGSLGGFSFERPREEETRPVTLPPRFGGSIGILLKRPSASPGRTLVGSIASGSLAESSGRIKEGDEVVAINGIDIDPLTLKRVSQILAQSREQQQVICVEIKRQGRAEQVYLDTAVSSASAAPAVQPSEHQFTRLSTNSLYSSVAPMGAETSLYASAPLAERSPFSGQKTSLRGIGVLLEEKGDSKNLTEIVIRKIKKGSQADRVGAMHEGDRILAIGEESAVGRELDWVKRKILGEAGTTLMLRLQPAANSRKSQPYAVVVVREGGFPTGQAEQDYGYLLQDQVPDGAFLGRSPPLASLKDPSSAQPSFSLAQDPVYSVGMQGGNRESLELMVSAPLQADTYGLAPQRMSSPVTLSESLGYNSPGALESVLMGPTDGDTKMDREDVGGGDREGADSQDKKPVEPKQSPTVIDSRPMVWFHLRQHDSVYLHGNRLHESSDGSLMTSMQIIIPAMIPMPSKQSPELGHVGHLQAALYSPEKSQPSNSPMQLVRYGEMRGEGGGAGSSNVSSPQNNALIFAQNKRDGIYRAHWQEAKGTCTIF